MGQPIEWTVYRGVEAMLKVIGVGFGRTGTSSLKCALETLGFGPCYHFTEALSAGHTRDWLRLADGEKLGWTHLLGNYRSTTDWPAAAYWRELTAEYPSARVILTVRDPNDWYSSVIDTIYALREVSPKWFPWARTVTQLVDKLIWDGIFDGKIRDQSYAIGKFEEHQRTVVDTIDHDRLLIFDVRDGWGPLCDFLDAEVPPTPFPHVNDSRRVHRLIRWIRLAKVGLPLLGACLLGAGLWVLF